MNKLHSSVFAIALGLISGCSAGDRSPSQAEILSALQKSRFSGPVGNQMNDRAIVGAEIISCSSGKRNGQTLASCDICLTATYNNNEMGYVGRTGNELAIYHYVINATLVNALSEAAPDAAPEGRTEGVWIALPEVSQSSSWNADYMKKMATSEILTALDYPTSRLFEGPQHFNEMLDKIESPSIASLIRSVAGKCILVRQS